MKDGGGPLKIMDLIKQLLMWSVDNLAMIELTNMEI